ncbi:MAG: urease accessory UreF family protein [Nocardioides sp.]
MDPRLILAMLADARLPSGAHTQSAGLEAMVQGGLTVVDIPDYLRTRLRTVTVTEAGTAVLARRAWLAGGPGAVEEVVAHWAARTPSHHARDAAERLGRGYARLARRLWPDGLSSDEATVRGCRADLRYPRPVVLGVVAAVTGLDSGDLARLIAYEDVQTIAAAALKLLPLDPVEAARWLLDLEPEIAALVAAVADLIDARELPAGGAPRLDHVVGIHAHAPRRLFHA